MYHCVFSSELFTKDHFPVMSMTLYITIRKSTQGLLCACVCLQTPIPLSTLWKICTASLTPVKAPLLTLVVKITSTWLPIPFANSTSGCLRVSGFLLQPTHEGFYSCLDIWGVFLDYLSTRINDRMQDNTHVTTRSVTSSLVGDVITGQ